MAGMKEENRMRKYAVYAEDMDGKRRLLDYATANQGGRGLFKLYADECGDEEEIIILELEMGGEPIE
jgi:hypothetical protein